MDTMYIFVIRGTGGVQEKTNDFLDFIRIAR